MSLKRIIGAHVAVLFAVTSLIACACPMETVTNAGHGCCPSEGPVYAVSTDCCVDNYGVSDPARISAPIAPLTTPAAVAPVLQKPSTAALRIALSTPRVVVIAPIVLRI